MSGLIVIIKPNGYQNDIPWAQAKPPFLETLQRCVGGEEKAHIEPIKIRYQGAVRQGYVDEDGTRKRLPTNRIASEMFGQPIVGTLVIWVPKLKGRLGDDL